MTPDDQAPPRSATEFNSLRDGLSRCTTWRMENGMCVGDANGWRFWLADPPGQDAVGDAVNLDLDVQVKFSPRLARELLARARQSLASTPPS